MSTIYSSATFAHVQVRGAHCSTPPAYKYLNSGGIAGRAGGVRAMLAAALALPRALILNKDWAVEDDQVAWRAEGQT